MHEGEGLHTVTLGFQADWLKEMLGEVLLLRDSDADGLLPAELLQSFLDFQEAPSELFSFDFKREVAGGADEYRIILKPSDRFLNFVLALRAWDRNRHVAV
ncbi:MAG TPA: hypothetical protein VNJ52_05125 [Patescibacteria group bacterium]|nr:hypothetical protein [Patescibacteria group bacterium]